MSGLLEYFFFEISFQKNHVLFVESLIDDVVNGVEVSDLGGCLTCGSIVQFSIELSTSGLGFTTDKHGFFGS